MCIWFYKNDIIRKRVKDFFKYVRMEGEAYLELFSKFFIVKILSFNELIFK